MNKLLVEIPDGLTVSNGTIDILVIVHQSSGDEIKMLKCNAEVYSEEEAAEQNEEPVENKNIHILNLVQDGEISTSLARKLIDNGIITIGCLGTFTRSEVSKLNGIGKKSLNYLEKCMSNHGVYFKEE